jgi:hypothetical protein
MARKSQALRLTQAKDTLAAYQAAGLACASQARFMTDMIGRLERGKYPTKRQRDWLDSIIEEGVPVPKGDPVYIAKIDEALKTEGIDFANILTDFRGKLVRGWDLSEKQKTWCDNLLVKAAELRNDSYWRPDAELTERIKLAVSLRSCYTESFWSTHPGGARAMAKADAWLKGDRATIDEYTVNKLFKSVTGRLRDMETPRFKMGAMGYITVIDQATHNQSRVPGIIVGGPIVARQGITYDILVGGKIITTTNISKRR